MFYLDGSGSLASLVGPLNSPLMPSDQSNSVLVHKVKSRETENVPRWRKFVKAPLPFHFFNPPSEGILPPPTGARLAGRVFKGQKRLFNQFFKYEIQLSEPRLASGDAYLRR